MKSVPHVALLVDTSISYQRDALHGIARYARAHRGWSFYVEQEPGEKIPDLRRWRGEGIITGTRAPRLVRAIQELGVPAVAITGFEEGFPFPLVSADDGAVGQRAAEHLLERGFQRFAFCGFAHSSRTAYSRDRQLAFVQRVEHAGFTCLVYKTRRVTARDWERVQADLTDWILSLEKPVGVMACNDVRARHVLEACRQTGVRVPEEVAVIGVDNDAIMCELSTPPLSSVDIGAERIGYRAAGVLDRLLAGEPAPPSPIFVQPGDVVSRQSTDVLAIEDRDIARALHFIRERACDGITVADVLARVPLARRTLERRFRRILGRSPHAEIRRVKINRARELMAATELPATEVAERCGFSYVQYMRRVFRNTTGMTPGQYRRESRQ
jgi:LacI family transcriptional regulator